MGLAYRGSTGEPCGSPIRPTKLSARANIGCADVSGSDEKMPRSLMQVSRLVTASHRTPILISPLRWLTRRNLAQFCYGAGNFRCARRSFPSHAQRLAVGCSLGCCHACG